MTTIVMIAMARSSPKWTGTKFESPYKLRRLPEIPRTKKLNRVTVPEKNNFDCTIITDEGAFNFTENLKEGSPNNM